MMRELVKGELEQKIHGAMHMHLPKQASDQLWIQLLTCSTQVCVA